MYIRKYVNKREVCNLYNYFFIVFIEVFYWKKGESLVLLL